jgi:hypothetical protein
LPRLVAEVEQARRECGLGAQGLQADAQPPGAAVAQSHPRVGHDSGGVRAPSATTGFDHLNRVQPVTDDDIAAINAEVAARAAAAEQRRAAQQQAAADEAATEGAAILAQRQQAAEQRQGAAAAYLAGTDNSPAAAAAFIDQAAAESGSEAEYLHKLRAAGLVEGGNFR